MSKCWSGSWVDHEGIKKEEERNLSVARSVLDICNKQSAPLHTALMLEPKKRLPSIKETNRMKHRNMGVVQRNLRRECTFQQLLLRTWNRFLSRKEEEKRRRKKRFDKKWK
jgi:hypothetical protein